METDIGWLHPIDQSDQWDGFNEPGIEHFAGNPITHLAREVNQNSYDSSNGSGVVKVKIKQLRVPTSTVPDLEGLRRTLKLCSEAAYRESLKAEQFFREAIEVISQSTISILEISDYQTKGMPGPSENGTPFYAFMKAKGQSRKESDTATGSFGIGKFAPYAVSKLRTVFVSTVYKDSNDKYQQLTQGKSILMSHDDATDRRQGAGFWGVKGRCQPVSQNYKNLPEWLIRTNDETKLVENIGTKLTILAFDNPTGWEELLAVSVAENFFGAINAGKLEVEIDNKYLLSKDSILAFFNNPEVRDVIQKNKNEPEQFDNCNKYLEALQNSDEIIVEDSETKHLGLCQLRIIIDEGLPKKVCFLRNGMFITDSLSVPGLKSFSDFKEFMAVVECKNKKGNELLRAMEPPRHDDFEPSRLVNFEEQNKGEKALKELATWIRKMLKRHAKNPVTEVTTLDELKDYFADESGEGEGKGIEEINPEGKVIIRLKPIKSKKSPKPEHHQGDETGTEGDSGGGGGSGSGSGDGFGGKGNGDGGKGGSGSSSQPTIDIENIRAIPASKTSRNIAFTPTKGGQLSLSFLEAGADSDYDLAIASSSKGEVLNGKVLLNVDANKRVNLLVDLAESFSGALKVVAHEI